MVKPSSQIPIEEKSFLEPLLEAITLPSAVNSIRLESILDGSLRSFARFSGTNVPFQIAATSEIGIPGRSRSRLFAVGGREDSPESTSAALIIVGFFSIAASRAWYISSVANFVWAVEVASASRVARFKATL